MGQIRSFYDWKKLMLQRRDLEVADGRQLYQYRLSAEEFNDLETFLRVETETRLETYQFSYVADRPGFADLFVLYGSEWWRRRYDGSGYAWEPILADLGVDASGWHPNHRSDCVRSGLHGWKLRTLRTGGHRYLGAVALQGGLPLRLLAEARGRISQVISRVLRLARKRVESPQELQSWVESLQTLLPISYRQREIYALLADIAWTLLDLKSRAELTSSLSAIAKLDHTVPGWRDRFPLPIDDSHAVALIEHLVREAATIRAERQALILPVERTLESGHDGRWSLSSSLDLPDTIDNKHLMKLFQIEDEELPRAGEITLIVGEKYRSAGLRKMAGYESYRLARTPWGFSGEEACREHVIRLIAVDGRVWSAPATKGQALENDLPWIFSGESEIPRLARQGSGSIVDNTGIVVMPREWQISASGDGSVERKGQISDLGRGIFAVTGNCTATDLDGNEFRIRTGNAGAAEEAFEWSGNRMWFGFKSPSTAFKGKPLLYSINEDGIKKKMPGEIDWKVIGAPSSRVLLGPVELRYPAIGEIKHRTRMVVLPETSSMKIMPDDPRSGVIFFEDWGLADVSVDSDGVVSRFASADGNALLKLSTPEGVKTPDEVEILAYWPHTTTPVHLVLPFPAKGVRVFDRDSHEIQQGSSIAVQQLIGTRLVILGASQYNQMSLRLRTTDKEISRNFQIKNNEGLLTVSVRIADFRTDIEHLLTVDDNPDSTVMLEFYLNGQKEFSLEITPYAFRPDRDETDIWVDFSRDLCSLGDGEGVPRALAMRLDHPGDEVETLSIIETEDSDLVKWAFAPNDRHPGAWLIYPPEDSPFCFRPTRWFVQGEFAAIDAYQRAITTRDETERHARIDALVAELASDFRHTNWTDIEQLANQIGHLPLATLDIWKRFARSSKGMAALCFRFSGLATTFLSRFAEELPFFWETVAFCDWQRAVDLAKKQCVEDFGEDLAESVLSVFLESRMSSLVAETGSLHYLFGILKASISDEAREEVSRLRIGGLSSESYLFVGELSLLNKLRQRHFQEGEEWPADLWDSTEPTSLEPKIQKYTYNERLGFQDSVINLPLILAAQVCCDQTSPWFKDPLKIHLLRQYRSFDPDWFDDPFNQTISRCLADGQLDRA